MSKFEHIREGTAIRADMGFAVEVPVEKDVAGVSVLPDGYIRGIASTPTVDSASHKVLAGAFDESIKKRGLSGPARVKLLAFHDSRKVAGSIKQLETVDQKLRIGAQLNLGVSYARDLHEIAKQDGGLSFSVGFHLRKWEIDEIDKEEVLIIKEGDLREVSIVAFPCQAEAVMEYVKSLDDFDEDAKSIAEFEKKLIQFGWAHGRNEAQRLWKLCRNSSDLFKAPGQVKEESIAQPLLAAHQLKAATDLLTKFRTSLGGARQ